MVPNLDSIPELEVEDKVLHDLLNVKPVSLNHQNEFKAVLVHSFERLSARLNPECLNGVDPEKYRNIECVFYVLYVSWLRSIYNEQGEQGLANEKGNIDGPWTWSAVENEVEARFADVASEAPEEPNGEYTDQTNIANSVLDNHLLEN